MAAEVTELLKGKTVLGLAGEDRRPGPAGGPVGGLPGAAHGGEAQVQVASSDGTARKWVAFGKFYAARSKGRRRSSTPPRSPMAWPRGSSAGW